MADRALGRGLVRLEQLELHLVGHEPVAGIRRDEWKLNYYYGMEPQLFNLAEDPGEIRDLAQDADYRQIRQELTEQVLDGWDPEVIARKMADIRRDHAVLRAWAQKVDPPESMRWDMRPEMGYLDGPT